jgi:broad specificity phosphatase PhoE
MKKALIVLSILFGILLSIHGQVEDKIFTIYLIRHSEKGVSENNPGDPPLSQCGELRSEKLVTIFGDIAFDRIYSSDFVRTRDTAKPIAESQGIEIDLYNPQKLKDLSLLLLSRGEDVLVVGHSNTTSVLAGMLIGEDLKPFDDSLYDQIYQVVIYKGRGRIHILNQGFTCEE